MIDKATYFIEQSNLSHAWAAAFLAIRSTPGHRLAPFMLTFTGFDRNEVVEDLTVRSALDAALASAGMQKITTVANTIFPQALWRRAKGDRAKLYTEYLENLPDYIAFEPHKNRSGLYFGRLIAYHIDHKTGEQLAYIPSEAIPKGCNQLEFIIMGCKKGVRVSEFQAAIFDPVRDHSRAAQLGFPCLQHVTFVPCYKESTLMLNAFYATQQLFEKGYGNYLGLARLGIFVASQVGLALSRVTCFVGVEKMEEKPQRGPFLDALVKTCGQVLSDTASLGEPS